jgi:branched-chain amino acid aminotransferase
MDVYYVDGEFVAAEEATLPVNDLAVLRGYGVFDFLRTYRGNPFCLEAHIERFVNSAQLIGLSMNWSQEALCEIVMETLSRNHHEESNIRLVLTGGGSTDMITPENRSRLLVLVTPVITFPEWWYARGTKVVTTPVERYIPEAKSINYIPGIIALAKARQQEAIEAIFIDHQGRALEGTTSNYFAVIDGQLVTPEDGVLKGVTRKIVLEITQTAFKPQLRSIAREELMQSDEVFLTSSNKEIAPVVRIDDTVIGDGLPGKQTQSIMGMFHQEKHNFVYTKGS